MSDLQKRFVPEGEGGVSPPPSLSARSPFFATLEVLAAIAVGACLLGGALSLYEVFLNVFLRH
jgi:hypothetical protein